MTFGLKIRNDNGNVIISDATSTFYYYGYASVIDSTSSSDYGGVSVFIYNTWTSKPIIPFIEPTTGSTTSFFAITRVFRDSSSYWNVEVAVTGVTAASPVLHIFTTGDAEFWSTRWPRLQKNNGLRVKRSDGSIAFDSTIAQPLSIRSAISVIPPAEPTAGGTALTPTESNEYDIPAGITKPMFGYYSMAMSERQYTTQQTSEECNSIDLYGACLGWTTVTVRTDLYWAFYRSAIKIDYVNSKFRCGWVTYSSGQKTDTQTSDSLSFFVPIVDIGGGSWSIGAGPFVNDTINRTSSVMLVADVSNYPTNSFVPVVVPARAVTNLQASQTYNPDDGIWYMSATWTKSNNAKGYYFYFQVVGNTSWTAYTDNGGLLQDVNRVSLSGVGIAYSYTAMRFMVVSVNQDMSNGNSAQVDF